ncbi:MAG: hypothetical protein ACP5K9_02335 [Candidatus Micrarchaeia archaeon]
MRAPIVLLVSFALAFVLVGAVNATYLQIEGPVSGTLYANGSIYIGKVGPGESFYILASANTTNSSGKMIYLGWNKLEAVSLPPGWSAEASQLYANPMKMKITAAPDAANGTYSIVIRAVNFYNYSTKREIIGNITDIVYVNVTPNVFALSVSPKEIYAGPGQPVNLYITINNTGASDDPFVINARGLPAWNVPDEVIALHSTVTTFAYPVYIDEPGVYKFNLTVSSATSPLVRKSYAITLVSHAGLLNDYSAIGEGVMLSPIIYEPAYAVMLFLGQVYKLLLK